MDMFRIARKFQDAYNERDNVLEWINEQREHKDYYLALLEYAEKNELGKVYLHQGELEKMIKEVPIPQEDL